MVLAPKGLTHFLSPAPSGTLNIMVTFINGSIILLSWKPLSPVEARGFVRYYLVTWTPGTRGTRGTTGGGTANLTADTTTFLITGLDPMVTYMVSVSAGTIAGIGATKTVASTGTAMPLISANLLYTPHRDTSSSAVMWCSVCGSANIYGCTSHHRGGMHHCGYHLPLWSEVCAPLIILHHL